MAHRAIWAAPVASGLMLAATGALRLLADLPEENLVSDVLPNAVLALSLPWLGALVLSRVPRHPLGRLWTATGTVAAVILFVHTYAELAVRESWVLGTAAAWIASWLWVLGFTPLLTLGLLMFPDGRLPSPRWRPLLGIAAAAVVLPIAGQALAPGRLEGLPVDNPFGVAALDRFCNVARSVGLLSFTLAAASGAAGLVVRWRRGTAEERRCLALPALAAGVLGATFLVPTVDPLIPWLDGLAVVEVSLLLAAFGVAVLRDSIAGVPVVVRRSLTYGLLTGLLALAYAATVALLATLTDERGTDLVATLVTALVALPLRDQLQRIVDRAVYGERADPFAALGRLGDRVAGAQDPAAVLAGVAESVADVLRLPAVQVLVGDAGAQVVAAAVGPEVERWTRLPLRHRGEEVGALLVAPRPGQHELDPRDLRMLEALQRQAATAVAAVRLSTQLQHSREQLVSAREEERRRLRRDLHDGLGPTLAGIGLGLEVARSTSDPRRVDALLSELKEEAAAAVLDVRRLVEDLRPPALDELGLLGALRRHADRLNVGERTVVDVDGPDLLDGLPAAVEVAAYRIAMEALTNAVRHGRPTRCSLVLRVDDALQIEVIDNGVGLPDDAHEGVGLGAMRERAAELGGTCTVDRRAGGGTTVTARLPVRAA